VFITYDSDADALYVQLRPPQDGVVETDEIDIYRYVDYDEQGQIIGVEFLGVSRGIDLTDVPEAQRVAEAIRTLPVVAAKLRGAAPAA
jgi:uncharacterized protein YuzE